MRVLLVAATLTIASLPSAARAADHAKKSRHEEAEAKKLYHEGDRAYAEGRYEDAAKAFEKAYKLSARPLLLFNLANAYERLGRYGDAADALERYLPDAKPEERDIVQTRLDNLKKRAAEEEAAKAPAPAPEPAPAPPPAKPAKPKPVTHASPPPTAGYVLLGVGGAAIATGAVFGVLALGARSDENANCTSAGGSRLCTSAASGAISRDKRDSLIADIGIGAGVVAAGLGAYLVLSHRGQEPQTAVGATARPGGGELSLVGRF